MTYAQNRRGNYQLRIVNEQWWIFHKSSITGEWSQDAYIGRKSQMTQLQAEKEFVKYVRQQADGR